MGSGYPFEDDDVSSPDRDAYEDEQLSLTDDETDRLPWLETGEYEERDAAFDSGRMLAFALVALLLLGVILTAIWWFTNRSVEGELQPNGTLIAAPDRPYKVRPDDPGGKTFVGTGDSSFAVGEGETREGRLATQPVPAPTASLLPTPTASPTASASPAPSGVNVQVGAYASKAAAEEGWRTLMRQTDKLNGVQHRVVRGMADIGVVYRLQALPGDLAAARRLCSDLKNDGVACQVKR